MAQVRSIGIFPFGQPVLEVVQTDRTPKRVFVLGVYASAVHAEWIGDDDRTIVKALAVASEPYIFWRGEKPESIIQRIEIPSGVGRLIPASPQFNGPSSRALDEYILKPLGLNRDDAWLCDLVPHSCMNPAQALAIKRSYLTQDPKYNLPKPTVPSVPKMLTDEYRRKAIAKEIREAGSSIIILLGDEPIRWFIRFFDSGWSKLDNIKPYGKLQHARIDSGEVMILPLAHPRQIGKLGISSQKWYDRHQEWIREIAPKLLEDNL